VNVRSREATEELRASLVHHALQLVARKGAAALTMRALAIEAGCALGMPYKVFADRRELVAEMMRAVCPQLELPDIAGAVLAAPWRALAVWQDRWPSGDVLG
jgi:AcrR family transcriptional regulator